MTLEDLGYHDELEEYRLKNGLGDFAICDAIECDATRETQVA